MSNSDGFRGGYQLGLFHRALIEYANQVAAGYRAAMAAVAHTIDTPEGRAELTERTSRAKYESAIERERKVGRAFVRSKANQLRRDLGLPLQL